MSTIDLPQLVCQHLPSLDRDAWEANAATLRDAQSCPLGQAWLPTPQPQFRPASVRTGWTDEGLFVYAELEDIDIFNPITEFNATAFVHGDVFEMFLRPADQLPYYEIHVSPQNQKLQLRFPSSKEFFSPRKGPSMPAEWFISSRTIESRVRVDATRNRWWVQALIPFDLVAESGPVRPGSRWLFSFSRYDYTHGFAQPVLSSTSPHQQVNFHRQEEWGSLLFQ